MKDIEKKVGISAQDNHDSAFNIDYLLPILLPAAGYYIAFKYESGFASVFGIPEEIIHITLISAFQIATLLIIPLTFIYGIMGGIAPLLEIIQNSGSKKIVLFLLTFLLLSILQFIYVPQDRYLAITTILTCFAVWLLYFGYPLISQRKLTGYWNKMEAEEKLDLYRNNALIKGRWRIFIGMLSIIIIVMIFLSGISYSIGRAVAHNQTNYATINYNYAGKNKECVVLRIYDNRCICASFIRDAKIVENKFIIMNLDSPQIVNYEIEHIGPLKRIDN